MKFTTRLLCTLVTLTLTTNSLFLSRAAGLPSGVSDFVLSQDETTITSTPTPLSTTKTAALELQTEAQSFNYEVTAGNTTNKPILYKRNDSKSNGDTKIPNIINNEQTPSKTNMQSSKKAHTTAVMAHMASSKGGDDEVHHLVFDPNDIWSQIFFAVVAITGALNIAASFYIIKHTHPLKRTKKTAVSEKRQTMFQSAASTVRRTMANIPAPWVLEQQFHAGRLTKQEREEVRRHEDHKLAFFTTTTDLFVTILVTTSICYSFFTDVLVDGLPCEIIGFAVFALLLMDITLVMFECIVMWMSFSQPRTNVPQRTTLQSCSRWILFVMVPWVLAAILFPFEAFGQDEFWCFAQVGHKSGKFALAVTVLFHYTILLIVLMCFIPIMRVSRHQRKYGSEAGKTTLSSHEVASNQSNAKHMLVHILHYTPGTLHSIATLCGATTAWLFIVGVAFVQLGAVMHAVLIWSHERHRRVARERRNTDDSWANLTMNRTLTNNSQMTMSRSATIDSQRTIVSNKGYNLSSMKELSSHRANAVLPAHLVTNKPMVHFKAPSAVAKRPSLNREIVHKKLSTDNTNEPSINRATTYDVEDYSQFLDDYVSIADDNCHSERTSIVSEAPAQQPQQQEPILSSIQNDSRYTFIPPRNSKKKQRPVFTEEPLPMDSNDSMHAPTHSQLQNNTSRHYP
ncbi:hypothetical protein BDF19DRAFT_412222 [Syncephalis fuscata]|nr:hypothetical protein BDF19DRAFT_412222 [Syncephalis fuscata]